MIIYNVTVKIIPQIQLDWVKWMKEVHIPDVMATGLFESSQIAKLIDPVDEDGFTYAIQYTCKDLNTLRIYHQNHAAALQAEHTNRYKDKFVSFRTLLEVVD